MYYEPHAERNVEMKLDTKKGADLVSGALHKATDISKAVAGNVQTGAKELADKTKNDAYLRKLKKYNPLFPDKYNGASFDRPNLITIVDDAVRRDIDVCEGAIGWLETKNDIEILYLYDTAVATSGLKFVPTAACDETYYVDNFDHQRYIRIDQLFNKAHEEKLAELQHIAASLGAKRCSIEIQESDKESQNSKKKFSMKSGVKVEGIAASSGGSTEQSISSKTSSARDGAVVSTFEGSTDPQMPTLKWFQHDDTIRRLIDSRLSDSNPIKTHHLKLEGSASATMSQKTASSIDGAVSKINSKKSSSMETQAKKENTSKLVFTVEF